MSKISNLPRSAWFIVGVVVTVILLPSQAIAAALGFTGIEGTSGNKAEVTSAGQLLTTEAKPSSYRGYETVLASSSITAPACGTVTPALSAKHAYDVQDVSVGFIDSGQQTTGGGTTNQAGGIVQFATARPSADLCTTHNFAAFLGDAVAQGGNTGTVDLPQRPGFVIPNGFQLYAYDAGGYVQVVVNGYQVRSSDAPTTSSGAQNKLVVPQLLKS